MDSAEFEVKLTDKVSGPAGKAAAGADDLASSLGSIKSATVEVTIKQTKLDRALKAAQLVHYGASAVDIGKRVWDSAGGFDGMREAAKKAGAKLAEFGRSALQAGKKVAPFAVGGAGIYGLAKVAGSVAVPALGAVSIGMAGVAAAAAAATIGVGLLVAKLAMLSGEKLASFAMFGQSAKFGLQQVAKFGASGDKLFDHAVQLANEYGMVVTDTVGAYQKLLAKDFSPKGADDIIKMGADLRGVGATAEEVKGAVRAITQIKAAGRLQGDEINQLAEAGIGAEGIYKALGKRMGKTVAEVMKLKEAGKVDAVTAIEAIKDAVRAQTGEKELGEVGKKFADTTLEGIVGRLKARGETVGIVFGERLLPGLQRVAGNLLDRFEGWMKSDRATQTIDKLGTAFERIADVAIKAMPFIDALVGGFSDQALVALGGVNDALGKMSAADTEKVAKSLREAGKGLADIVIFGGQVVGVVGGIVGALGVLEAKLGINGLGSVIAIFSNPIGAATDAVITKVTELVPKAFNLGLDFVKGLADGIKSGASYAVDAIADVGNSVVGKIRGVWDSHSPSRVAGSIGLGFDQGLGVGLYGGAHIPIGAAESVAFGTVRAASDVMTSRPAFASAGPMLASAQLDYAGASPRGPMGGGALSVTNENHFHGSTDPADVEAAIERGTRRAVDAYFRQLDMEG